jgi:fibronectin type 3 domain-containing protein
MVTINGLIDLFGNAAIGTQTLSLNDTIAPEFTGLDWIDVDASTSISQGDQYVFHFDETMDVSVIQDGTQDANFYMRPSGGLRYGNVNTINWSIDGKDLTVTITEGFTVLGDELVIPSSFVTDMAGNSVIGTHPLQGRDTTPPELSYIRFDDADGSGTVTEGDRYFFGFNESMMGASLSNNSTEGNENLSPEGKKYGTINSISWNTDYTECVITITYGFTVEGDELVDPTDQVTDRAGNPVINTMSLTLIDTIVPELADVSGNYISPVSAVNNYRLSLRFNSAMDTSVQPVVEMISSGAANPVVPDGGTWLTTIYPDDTYVTPDIILSEGMDGQIQVNVSDAQDTSGNGMQAVTDAFTFELDAVPPASPSVSLLSSDCDSAIISWTGYTAPADLAGFQVFRESVSFSDVAGLSPIGWVNSTGRTYEVGSLALNTSYYTAVVAVDSVGNRISEVSPVEIYISRPIPPQVSISVGPGNDPDSADVSWQGYDTAGLCGFAGFRLYYEEFDFTSVTGLTPKGTIDAAFSEASVGALDRTRTYYFAVVGFNNADEYDPEVTTASWSDPYAGQITQDTVIGGGQQAEISISQTMIVMAGATLTIEPGTVLYFAPGTGIQVQSGALVVEGTALDPVVLTSENDRAGSTPAADDWSGITLESDAGASTLSHVFIKYSESGLTLNDVTPTVTALSCLHNSMYGLRLTGSAELNTTDALIIYNSTGIQTEGTAHLIISNSVIKLNSSYNAVQMETSILTAENNWWGATEAAGIGSSVSGTVDYEPYLSYEPLLTPAIGTADGETSVGTQEVTLKLACRTAEEMRISEDSTFDGQFFGIFAPAAPFTLSVGGGIKTVFAQFRSSTGTVSNPADAFIEITYITEGPEIQSFSITEGQTVTRPLTVSGEATATLGMDVIEFYLDDVLVEQTGGTTLSFLWDVRTLSNGIYRAKLLATDLSGNIAVSEHNIIISIIPPPAPVISGPADNTLLTAGPVTISGSAEPFIDVRITRNGFVEGIITADENGQFELAGVPLVEGDNEIIAVAFDDVGLSANSNRVNVILDTGPPAAPVLLDPSVSVGIGVVLQWQYAEEGERPSRFRVYRSSSTFTQTSQAVLIKDNLTDLTYTDTQAPDGTLYYGVTGLDNADHESVLSNVVSVDYDSTSPAFGVAYNKTPPFGPGNVEITLTVTEELFSLPTLTIKPFGTSVPESVTLTWLDDFTCTGTYEVAGDMPAGIADVLVSGRDMTGNAFSGEPSGVDFIVDTQGPVGSVSIDAVQPVQVLVGKDVNVTLILDEQPVAGTTPLLRFTPPEGSVVNIGLSGAGNTWSGVLHLTSDMGSGNGQFTMEVEDDQGNTGTGISAGEYFEIYNTALPSPPPAPEGLSAVSKPDGAVDLSWSGVALAESYSVYRSSGDCTSAPVTLVADGLIASAYTDNPLADGNYCYGVTAERRSAESDMSDTVQALADGTAPGMPENVSVILGAAGVIISWDAPSAGETPDMYYVYRNGVRIRTVTGSLSAIDYPVTGGSYEYQVAASDTVGNESISAVVIFNLTVGAVSNLEVVVHHGALPELTWESSDPGVEGFNVYRGGIKLNAGLIVTPSFTDIYYAGASMVEYEVRAVNGNGEESPPRLARVYPVNLDAVANPDETGQSQPLVADYFDLFEVSVTNQDAANTLPLDQLQLRMTVEGTEIFAYDKTAGENIAEGSPFEESLVIPCGSSLEDHALKITAVQSSDSGTIVIYDREFIFTEVTREGVSVEMSINDVPLAGGYSTVNTCIQNNGTADMDIVVNRQHGAEPGDIYVIIRNEEGLEISRGLYDGSPSGTWVLPDGTSYVTLEAGESVCVDVTVLVPEALEEDAVITFEGVVGEIYHHFGKDDQLASGDLTGSMDSGITLSEYYGTAQADKNGYSNDETIIITGQAIDRETGDPRPNTGLKIGFFTKGFHWFKDIVTDNEGNYTYEYLPVSGVSGHFVIWAAHPDVYDIIHQDEFDVYRIYCRPSEGDIRMSKADTVNFRMSLFNPGDVPLTDFTSSFRAYTIDGGGNEVDEPKVNGSVNYTAGFAVGPGQTEQADLVLSAAIDAPDDVVVEYTFISSQGASVTFTGSVSLLPAVPIISVDEPAAGYVDISIDRGSMMSKSVTITNRGLEDLLGAEITPPENISWMTTNLPLNEQGKIMLGDILVGESRSFDVVFMPPADTDFGYHQDKIVIKGTNSEQEFNIHLYAKVTSNLVGSVLFHVTNILDQDVEGATIRMRNTAIHEEITPVETDENGETLITELQEGNWSWQVIAPGHSTQAGMVTVVADQTVSAEPILSRTLVSINFTVEPVPFTDRYEIKIEQTFETHVPFPVLVADPSFMKFDDPEPGFEANFIVTLTNHGLVKAHDVSLSSHDIGVATLEPLIDFLPEIGAMQSIEIPYRMVFYGEEDLSSEGGALSLSRSGGGLVECAKAAWSLFSNIKGRWPCSKESVDISMAIKVICTIYKPAKIAKYIVQLLYFLACLVDGDGDPGEPGDLPSLPGGGDWPYGPPGPLPNWPSYTVPGGPPCFSASAPILMADGSTKLIEAVKVGDQVMAFNGKPDRVKRVYRQTSDHIREIWYRDDEGNIRRLETTDGHLFWVKSKEWIPARKLLTGDFLITKDQKEYMVERNERFDKPISVYNFDVSKYRSYFAGGVLVHERCGMMESDPVKNMLPGGERDLRK